MRVEHVSFGYSPETTVLHDINLDVRAGQTVAFVGETGAGKSSLVALLSHFYDVKQGHISIDGYDVRKVKRESLRRQMGVVLQATFLFSAVILVCSSLAIFAGAFRRKAKANPQCAACAPARAFL